MNAKEQMIDQLFILLSFPVQEETLEATHWLDWRGKVGQGVWLGLGVLTEYL